MDPLLAVLLAQYYVAAVASAFNAIVFGQYPAKLPRHRLGARVLALLSVAIFVESVGFGALVFAEAVSGARSPFLDPRQWLAAHFLLCLAALALAALTLGRR
jgi:hypothetical protein